MSWYLTHESLTCLPSAHSCSHHGNTETNIISIACNIGVEVSRLSQEWNCLLRKTRYPGLVLLLGAGGVVVYLLLQGRKHGSPGSRRRTPRYQPRSFWSWLFDEELVEDLSKDSYFLHSHYFGPSTSPPEPQPSLGGGSSNEADVESGDDVSLNSLSLEASPRRLLKRPLFDIRTRGRTQHYLDKTVQISNPCPRCVKGTCRLKKHQIYQNTCSGSSSNYSGSPQNQTNGQKTSTPELEDDRFICRVNSSLPGFFRPGRDERKDGDGSDESDPSHLADELAKFNGTPVGYLKDQYRPTHRLMQGSYRGAPDGKERLSISPVTLSRCQSPGSVENNNLERTRREDSLDSENELQSMTNGDVSGSMLDLVQNAREVRRLIRETSFDSTTSDLDLDFSLNENLGGSTAEGLDTIYSGINKIMLNCENLEQDISFLPEQKLVVSKSSMSGLSQYAGTENEEDEESNLQRDGSVPDLRVLQRTLRSNKGVWKLTDFSGLSDREGIFGSRQASIVSDSGSFEWDSPIHGWHGMKSHRVPLISSSNVSESGDEVGSFSGSGLDPWEWDDCYIIQDGEDEDMVERMDGHKSWLPEMSAELDLESELRLRELNSQSSSNRSSLERGLYCARRQPPSGRSSVDRLSISSQGSSFSDDLTITGSRPFISRRSRSRSNSISKLSDSIQQSHEYTARLQKLSISAESGVLDTDSMDSSRTSMDSSRSSLDTGISSMDTSVSSVTSSIFVSSINLSPVKEAKEPPLTPPHLHYSSPMSTSTNSPLSPEIMFGKTTSTKTVIKLTQTVSPSETRRHVAKTLFSQEGDQLNVEDELNENIVLEVRVEES